MTVFALLTVAIAVLAGGAAAGEPEFFENGAPGTPAEELASQKLLRLPDMPAGFVLGEESFCGEPRDKSENYGVLEQEEHLPPTPQEAFIKTTGSVFCIVQFERLYRAAGTGATPLLLASFAFTTPSAAAAARGLALGPELIEETFFTEDFNVGVAPAVGEEAHQFDTVLPGSWRFEGKAGVLLMWRQGATIAGVFAVASTAGVSARAASTYAARQQSYVLSPRPYSPGESEDRLTFLENPNIDVPLYWLGPNFHGKGGNPTFFEGAFTREGWLPAIPFRQLSVLYFNYLKLDTWTRSGWAKFTKTAMGRLWWTWGCTRTRTVKLPHGHAVIYGSYGQDESACPSRKPEHFSAHVFLPGVVIAIGEPQANSRFGEGAGTFESWQGLESVIRGLRRYRG
ncbi:MAG: hypothetical protein JWO14_3183 [Solirubrobacterales bacterium]|nr:hypothetical protein [Solirubrobacterales bacterium]